MSSRDEALALARYVLDHADWRTPHERTLARALLDCEDERDTEATAAQANWTRAKVVEARVAELERDYSSLVNAPAKDDLRRAIRAEARVAEFEKALSRIEEAASTGSTNDVFEALEQIRKELEFPLDGAKIHAIDCDLDDDCTCSP